jgi:hypothetical protein
LGNIFLYKVKKTYLDPNDYEQEEGWKKYEIVQGIYIFKNQFS